MKSKTLRGIGAGLGLFLALFALAYLTPARVPVMKGAGRDYLVLRSDLLAKERALTDLQPAGFPHAAASPEAARARLAVTSAQTRIGAWERLNSNLTPFGFFGWVSDLWPWLLGLGLAFPVLGGLIGAQCSPAVPKWGVRHPEAPSSAAPSSLPPRPEVSAALAGHDAASSAPAALPPISPFPSSAPFVEGASSAEPPPVSQATAGSEPAAWNWNARPAARATPSRPKPPPVRSPHGDNEE